MLQDRIAKTPGSFNILHFVEMKVLRSSLCCQVCGGPALSLFRTGYELELLIAGVPQLDFDDLEAVARYEGDYNQVKMCSRSAGNQRSTPPPHPGIPQARYMSWSSLVGGHDFLGQTALLPHSSISLNGNFIICRCTTPVP